MEILHYKSRSYRVSMTFGYIYLVSFYYYIIIFSLPIKNPQSTLHFSSLLSFLMQVCLTTTYHPTNFKSLVATGK
ncbi:hypothetical protein EUGRSUZ_B02923 [Eucalyptus grandis]|uniref:Uncharacterized protein n=2 Tax=Eucalyptus grandis TaxID=71139 RepID=A0A059D7M6_EUCGR|nr:hypothetical protein EUGRSUZ_B02923 [Eucalyptus grandis]